MARADWTLGIAVFLGATLATFAFNVDEWKTAPHGVGSFVPDTAMTWSFQDLDGDRINSPGDAIYIDLDADGVLSARDLLMTDVDGLEAGAMPTPQTRAGSPPLVGTGDRTNICYLDDDEDGSFGDNDTIVLRWPTGALSDDNGCGRLAAGDVKLSGPHAGERYAANDGNLSRATRTFTPWRPTIAYVDADLDGQWSRGDGLYLLMDALAPRDVAPGDLRLATTKAGDAGTFVHARDRDDGATTTTSSGRESLEGISEALFEKWVLPFEALSVLLLVALIGSVALAARSRSQEDEEVDL